MPTYFPSRRGRSQRCRGRTQQRQSRGRTQQRQSWDSTQGRSSRRQAQTQRRSVRRKGRTRQCSPMGRAQRRSSHRQAHAQRHSSRRRGQAHCSSHRRSRARALLVVGIPIISGLHLRRWRCVRPPSRRRGQTRRRSSGQGSRTRASSSHSVGRTTCTRGGRRADSG